MKKWLPAVFIACTQFLNAQYCGVDTSLSSQQSSSFLTVSNDSFYVDLPCAQIGVSYSTPVQMIFDSSYFEGINVTNIYLNSMSNLPCGLCWQGQDSSLAYTPTNDTARFLISGVCTDSPGTYTVYLLISGYVSDTNQFSFYAEFLVNVIPANSDCLPPDPNNLNANCSSRPQQSGCSWQISLQSSVPSVNCQFDSTILSVVAPTGPGFKYYWWTVNDSAFDNPFSDTSYLAYLQYQRVDSVSNSFVIYSYDGIGSITVTDSAGCQQGIEFNIDESGPYSEPVICYTTTDTAQGASNDLIIAWQKNNWANADSLFYFVVRQDNFTTVGYPTLTDIGEFTGMEPGIVVDTSPFSFLYLDTNSYYPDSYNSQQAYGVDNEYLIYLGVCDPNEGDAEPDIDGAYEPLVAYGDTFNGYPYIEWYNAYPINYSKITILSSKPGSGWRPRFSTTDFNTTLWQDLAPDSTVMQYVIAMYLIAPCDPSRSETTTAFSNHTNPVIVNPAVVVPDTATASVGAGITGNITNSLKAVLYPNPATDKMIFQLSQIPQPLTSVKIYNALGQIVASQNVTGIQTTIATNTLQPGVYSLVLYNDSQRVLSKNWVKL